MPLLTQQNSLWRKPFFAVKFSGQRRVKKGMGMGNSKEWEARGA